VTKGKLVAIRYPSAQLAERAAAEVRALAGERALELEDAAVAVKHEGERVELRQLHGLAAGEGLVAGGAIGLLLGVPLGLPVAAALVGMAGGGGVSALDRGISDRRMRDVASSLQTGEAILFLLAAGIDWSRLRERLAPYEGALVASGAVAVP